MQNVPAGFNENRRIGLKISEKSELVNRKCVANLMGNRRNYRAKKRNFKGIEFYLVRSGFFRESYPIEEDWGWTTWVSKDEKIAYELVFTKILPVEKQLSELFEHIVNPTGERQGHIHNIGVVGHVITGPKSLIVAGHEYLNCD